jgi:hypothetical protein
VIALPASTSAVGKPPLEIDCHDRSAAVKRRRLGGAGKHLAPHMTHSLIDSVSLLEGLEASGSQVVIVATGGGSSAIPHLLATPGASSVVL